MDFGSYPPEVNSARMYAGAGSGPMLAAAEAWDSLATELHSVANSYQSVISGLTAGSWMGPASVSMSAAAASYAAWLRATAAQAEETGAQARSAAAAYQTAFTATVPPPMVAANRSQLMTLIATNLFGRNTQAIAANEAQYGQMWAQDAAAMYGYAGASASAGKLAPLSDPASTTNAGGLGGQAAAVTQATGSAGTSAGLPGLVSALPAATQSLSTPLSGAAAPASALSNFFSNSLVQNIPNGFFDMGAWNGFNAIVTGILYAHTADAGLMGHSFAPAFGGLGVLPSWPMTTSAAVTGVGGSPVLAGMGDASLVGKLSVPVGWSAATPVEPAAAAPLTGSGWTAPAEEAGGVNTVAAGMPAYASAGRGGYGVGPRYGVKPTVMPKQVFV